MVANGTRECFMGAVTGVECDGEYVRGSLGQRLGGLAQTPRTQIAGNGAAGCCAERPREVKARDFGDISYRIQGRIAAQVAFDVPQCFAGNAHVCCLVQNKASAFVALDSVCPLRGAPSGPTLTLKRDARAAGSPPDS
jgi:hypothetical protein